jgi:hypothetical protein
MDIHEIISELREHGESVFEILKANLLGALDAALEQASHVVSVLSQRQS